MGEEGAIGGFEMKTLKDLEQIDYDLINKGSRGKSKIVSSLALREIAREWIKFLNDKKSWGTISDNDKASYDRPAKNNAVFLHNSHVIIAFIKHLFNLEDEK